MSVDFQDRCRGLMVGLGVGNLLGIGHEGRRQPAIKVRRPDGIRDIEASSGYPDDDDLAQAIILAEAAVEAGSGELDVDDLGRRFWIWGEENGLGMGGLTGQVLTRIGGARPWRARESGFEAREPRGLPALSAAREVWEESGRRSAGNGSVMRCAPLAIRWADDDRKLALNSALSAVPTHADPRCIWCTVAANLATAPLLRGREVTAAGVVSRLRQIEPELRAALEARGVDEAGLRRRVTESCSLGERMDLADAKLDGWDMGYTLKALQVALWCAVRASDFEESLIAVVSAGGDTDTNGAVAGAVLGARFGLKAIPDRWLQRLGEIRQGRAPLEALADRLMASA